MGMHSMHRVAAPSVRMSLRTRLKKCIGVLSFFDYFWQEPIFFRQLPHKKNQASGACVRVSVCVCVVCVCARARVCSTWLASSANWPRITQKQPCIRRASK